MEELLKSLGYTDEQIQAVIAKMKEMKIYTSKEENIDLRYQKLQDDFNAKDGELGKANDLIKKLQDGNKNNEDLQTKIKDYEAEITKMKEEQAQDKIENAIKIALLSNKAKSDDIDYLMFKIKNGENKVELDDNNFESKSNEFVDVKKLGSEKGASGNDTEEPATLLDALKDKYAPKEEM